MALRIHFIGDGPLVTKWNELFRICAHPVYRKSCVSGMYENVLICTCTVELEPAFGLSSTTAYGHSVPARLGKWQGAKEIGHNLARERPKFGRNLVRKRHKIGHSLERE